MSYTLLMVTRILLIFFNKRVVLRYTTSSDAPSTVIIQDISTDDKLKTMFADITENPEQDLNNIKGSGIMTNTKNVFATTERNYPINEAGTLFYGTTAYERANQIYGGFSSNRWFARGGGDNNYTPWREFVFKDDIDTDYVESGSIDNLTAVGEYFISPNVANNLFTDYCWLKIMGGSAIIQILIEYNSLRIAIRQRSGNNIWSPWKFVATSDNLSTITKMTTSEYNASSKDSQTAYFVTD